MDRQQLLNDEETALRVALMGLQASMWTAFPAIVSSVDFSEMTLVAQPAIKGQVSNPDGSITFVNLPLLVDVPIVFPSAGGFVLTMPIKVGSEVLIIIASRCIDSWWQNGGVQIPIEDRMHDLSDGFALPGPMSLPNVPGGAVSTDNAELRSLDGTQKISLVPGGAINIVAPGGLNVTGNLVVSGTVEGDGIQLTTHIHSGVTSGGSDTGPPL